MKYNTPELLPVGTIEATVKFTSQAEPPDNSADPPGSRSLSTILDID